MKDIVKAIEIEKKYIEHRMKGEEPFHLVDVIKEFGFESLKEYFEEKCRYEFNQLEFDYEECKPHTCLDQVFASIRNKETKFLYMVSDCTFVFSCNDVVNTEYCEQNNIPIYYTQARGGTIVSTEGDVSLCICLPDNINVDTNFILENIAKILRKDSNVVKVDGNDILIDDKKVFGSATYRTNGMFALVAHVSFNDDSELISNICRTPKSGKIPSYIKNITQEEFRLGVSEWLQEHYI